MSNSTPLFQFDRESATPFSNSTATPPPSSQRLASSTPGPGQTQNRIEYTESLKIALLKLCVFNSEQYLNQEEAEAKFWVHIHDEFAPIANLPPPDRTKINAGNNICVEVKGIAEARQKELELRGVGTSGIGGSSAGNSELDQITDQWLEIVSWKQREKEQKTLKVKEEAEKEENRRQKARNHLTQHRSQREDIREVERALQRHDSENTSQLAVREKRRKIGTARSQVRKRAFDEADTELRESFLKSSELVQETLKVIQKVLQQSVQHPASSLPLSSMPSASDPLTSIPSTSIPSASTSIPSPSTSVPSASSLPSVSSMSSASLVPTREEFDQLSAKVMSIEQQLLEIQAVLNER